MGELDLEFMYRAGCKNIAADALSCHPTYYLEHVDINTDIRYLVHPDCYAAIPLLLSDVSGSY